MPSKEMQYSGNWFYDSIGGTLAMSRSLFWDTFMVGKIQDAHIKAVELSAAILDKLASDRFKGKAWCIDESKPSADDMCGTYKGTARWTKLAYTTTYKSSELQHVNKSASNFATFSFSPCSTVHTLAQPRMRQGEMVVQQDIELDWEEGVEPAEHIRHNITTALAADSWDVRIRGSLRLTLETTITLKAVNSTGELQVESNTKMRCGYEEPNVRVGGLVGSMFPRGLRELVDAGAVMLGIEFQASKAALSIDMAELSGRFRGVAEGLKSDLNQQNKFLFPGSGTFDMKDPTFNDHGDLMIGLTYR
ncbi:MAG: hypothetical protein Q9169_007067 [Polycauliona sp. 2 TL-2023]